MFAEEREHGKKSILIVEDEQISALDLKDTLTSLGYRVTGIASTGDRAIEMVDEDPPDLILMDINLAGSLSGIDAAEQIILHHTIPIIYVTAYADPELIDRAKWTRPYGYIIKPYDERGIRTEIEIALHKAELDRNLEREYAALEQRIHERTGELARINAALEKSETRYRLLFEKSGEGIFIFEAGGKDRGKIVEVNAAGAAMHGYLPEELLTLKITDLDVAENLPAAPTRFEEILRGEWIGGEVNHVRKDKSVFPLDFHAGLLELDGHNYVFSVMRDISEQKRVRDEIVKARDEWERTFNAVTDLIAIIDRNFKVVRVNKAMADRLGVSQEGAVGLCCYAAVHHTPCPPDTCPHRLLLADGKSHTVDIHEENLKGDFTLSVSPILGPSHEILGSVHILHDITERKQAEEALKESEEKYRTLFENMLEGFAYCRMISDANGTPVDWIYLDVNRAFERLTGLKNIVGKRFLEAIPGIRALSPELFDTYGRVSQTGTPETFEIDFKPLDIWLRVSVFSPKKEYFVAVFEDISERKEAETALKVSEEKYRAIIENMQDLFYRTDLDGTITMMSPAGARFAGCDSPDDMIGMNVSEMYAEPEKRTQLLSALEEKGAVTDYPLILKVRDGSLRIATTNSHYYHDADGTILGVEGLVHDITGLRQAEDALRMVNKKLNLLSSITRHDIRNQLMALKAFIQLSEDSVNDPGQLVEFLKKQELISDTIERQIAFTSDYEDMGVKSPVWQDVESLVRKKTNELPLREIRVETGCPGLEVFADPLLEKVFYNLIDNALRYGGEKMTRILISDRESATGLVISVEDDGVGISAEDKVRLFGRGFGHHTGFGLFLSREILSITGMTITENGEPGRGARFEITVPKGGYRFSSTRL